MAILTYTTDDKARIILPKGFANSTVLIEQVSDTELRVRKARVIAEDDLPFLEESMAPLSDRDRDAFLAILENPPAPNDALRHLLSGHVTPQPMDFKERSNSVGTTDLVSLTWPEFFAVVKRERHGRLMHERLKVVAATRQLFGQAAHFSDLEYAERRKIAGLVKNARPDFLLFGSMQAVGLFKQAIKENNKGISLALDEIPLDGAITHDHYQKFTNRFLKAFKHSGMALASRLLAMKRPDTFVCVNNENREGLFQALRLSPSRDAETYWQVIEKIRSCVWWNAPAPAVGDEREVWRARAAFLDAHFYTGVGMSPVQGTKQPG